MIPLFKVFMSYNVDEPLLETLHSGYVGQGPKVEEFERALVEYVLNPRVLTLSAGTHGLHLALRLLGIGPGDEVITTALTCTATNWSIMMQGADIVYADIGKDLNISSASIQEKITNKTRAIIVVHWGGYPCDLDEISKIAYFDGPSYRGYIPIIEDAAHAFGSTYKGHITGDCYYSDFCMFSFQAIKLLTTVDGGALFCDDNEYYKRGKLLRWYGINREGPRKDMRCEEDIVEWGYKYHMSDVCATIGLSNLKRVNDLLDECRENAEFYIGQLKNLPDVTLTQLKDDRSSSYWLFTILVDERANFARKMEEKGIMVSRVHERTDMHTCQNEYRKNDLPMLDKIVQKMICIPVGWWVSKEDREYIVDTIKGGW